MCTFVTLRKVEVGEEKCVVHFVQTCRQVIFIHLSLGMEGTPLISLRMGP